MKDWAFQQYPLQNHSDLRVSPHSILVFWYGLKRHDSKQEEKFDDWYTWMEDGDRHGDPNWVNNDQPFISGQIMKHGLKWETVDQTWNDTPTHWKDDQGYERNFLHYTGGGNKVIMMDDYKKGKFKYLKP